MEEQTMMHDRSLAMRQRLAQVDVLETAVAEAVGEKATAVATWQAVAVAGVILGLCVGIVLPF